MRWKKKQDDGWRKSFALFPVTIGDTVVWLEHFYQRFEGLYWNVRTVEDVQAMRAAIPTTPPSLAGEGGEEIEGVIACLGDDAQLVRKVLGADSEIATNMERAAQLLEMRVPTLSPSQGTAVTEARNLFAPGDVVRHRKGNTYKVEGRCIVEATMADCYAYRGEDGRLWIRPALEMEDGRFVLVEHAALASPAVRDERKSEITWTGDGPFYPNASKAYGQPDNSAIAWLIEGKGPNYLSHFSEEHNGSGFCWFPKFTKDPNSALRFSRKDDAEKLLLHILTSFPSGLSAVEHAWIGMCTHQKVAAAGDEP